MGQGWHNIGVFFWTEPGCIDYRPPKLARFAGHSTALWCFCALQSFSAAPLPSSAINWNVQTFLLGLTGAETCLYTEGHVRSFGRVHCLKRQPHDIPLATQCAHSRCFLTSLAALGVYFGAGNYTQKASGVFAAQWEAEPANRIWSDSPL